MPLDRVTFTGADDSVDPELLAEISAEYPFVEWGILFSPTWQETPRYPSMDWLIGFHHVQQRARMQTAAHLCGRWVRELVMHSNFSWWDACHPDLTDLFDRVQINFHGQFHKQDEGFGGLLFDHQVQHRQKFIFQCDGVNDATVLEMASADDLMPLFDTSGGAGRLPSTWPAAWPGIYCGYAGGLGPDNVVEQLAAITSAAGQAPFWIDMERRVRSADDAVFDLGKVRAVLAAVQAAVNAGTQRRML